MKSIDRRRFLLAAAAAATGLEACAHTRSISSPAKIVVHPEQPGPAIQPNFVGLSYETQQLSDCGFFAPSNTGLIARFRGLAPHGVLRIGGNTSDVGWWKATPSSKQPPLLSNVVLQTPPGERPPLDLAYAVTPEAVRNLRAFLDATGWTYLYGINLGASTPALAADQAAFVSKTLGSRLEYFQVGNEPNGFGNRFRNRATWNVESYLKGWLAAAKAIRARVPDAAFGLPDVAFAVQWCTAIADRISSMSSPPRIAAVTHHYYFGGPPSNPRINIDDLLHRDPRVASMAELARTAAARLHTQFRMTEGNTCYRGGKPGVSDVFASSLWAADYLLSLAGLGYAGVNLHGGSGKACSRFSRRHASRRASHGRP